MTDKQLTNEEVSQLVYLMKRFESLQDCLVYAEGHIDHNARNRNIYKIHHNRLFTNNEIDEVKLNRLKLDCDKIVSEMNQFQENCPIDIKNNLKDQIEDFIEDKNEIIDKLEVEVENEKKQAEIINPSTESEIISNNQDELVETKNIVNEEVKTSPTSNSIQSETKNANKANPNPLALMDALSNNLIKKKVTRDTGNPLIQNYVKDINRNISILNTAKDQGADFSDKQINKALLNSLYESIYKTKLDLPRSSSIFNKKNSLENALHDADKEINNYAKKAGITQKEIDVIKNDAKNKTLKDYKEKHNQGIKNDNKTKKEDTNRFKLK